MNLLRCSKKKTLSAVPPASEESVEVDPDPTSEEASSEKKSATKPASEEDSSEEKPASEEDSSVRESVTSESLSVTSTETETDGNGNGGPQFYGAAAKLRGSIDSSIVPSKGTVDRSALVDGTRAVDGSGTLHRPKTSGALRGSPAKAGDGSRSGERAMAGSGSEGPSSRSPEEGGVFETFSSAAVDSERFSRAPKVSAPARIPTESARTLGEASASRLGKELETPNPREKKTEELLTGIPGSAEGSQEEFEPFVDGLFLQEEGAEAEEATDEATDEATVHASTFFNVDYFYALTVARLLSLLLCGSLSIVAARAHRVRRHVVKHPHDIVKRKFVAFWRLWRRAGFFETPLPKGVSIDSGRFDHDVCRRALMENRVSMKNNGFDFPGKKIGASLGKRFHGQVSEKFRGQKVGGGQKEVGQKEVTGPAQRLNPVGDPSLPSALSGWGEILASFLLGERRVPPSEVPAGPSEDSSEGACRESCGESSSVGSKTCFGTSSCVSGPPSCVSAYQSSHDSRDSGEFATRAPDSSREEGADSRAPSQRRASLRTCLDCMAKSNGASSKEAEGWSSSLDGGRPGRKKCPEGREEGQQEKTSDDATTCFWSDTGDFERHMRRCDEIEHRDAVGDRSLEDAFG